MGGFIEDYVTYCRRKIASKEATQSLISVKNSFFIMKDLSGKLRQFYCFNANRVAAIFLIL